MQNVIFNFFLSKITILKQRGIICREAGVGFATSPPANPQYDCNRTELLKLLLTCFSEAMYLPPTGWFRFKTLLSNIYYALLNNVNHQISSLYL